MLKRSIITGYYELCLLVYWYLLLLWSINVSLDNRVGQLYNFGHVDTYKILKSLVELLQRVSFAL